jgi:hypothetical protein
MELQTNLLPLIHLPRYLRYGDTNVPGYPELRQLLGEFKLRCRLYGGKLVFLGNPEPVQELFKGNPQYYLKDIGRVRFTEKVLVKRREVVVPILYDVIAAFFGYKGLRHVPNQRGHVYMVDHDIVTVGNHPQQMIYNLEEFKNRRNRAYRPHSKDTGPYVHEGFEYQLEFVADKLYLALIPRIVLTVDKNQVMAFDDAIAMYTSLNSHRWNKELRWLLYVWSQFLGEGSPKGSITILTPGEGEKLVFSSYYAKVQRE